MKLTSIFFILSFLCATFANAQNQRLSDESTNPQARYEFNKGVELYKSHKFVEAEKHFRRAVELEPSNRVLMIFMAKTLHRQYLDAHDNPENIKKAGEAIEIYQMLLDNEPSFEAAGYSIINLIRSIRGEQARIEWLTKRANDEKVKSNFRAEAFTLLASDKFTCVNEITETAKETIEKNNEAIFVFRKPIDFQVFENAKNCADEGLILINKAVALDENSDTVWSYKASFLIQKARLAQMDGNDFEANKFQTEANEAKARFIKLAQEKAEKREKEERNAVKPN